MSKESFVILSSFCRAIGHKMRTPLSVLSNELSYVESVIENSGDAAKSREKLNILVDLLKFDGYTKELSTQEDELTLSSVVATSLKRAGREISLVKPDGELALNANSSHLLFVLKAIFGMLKEVENYHVEVETGQVLIAGRAPAEPTGAVAGGFQMLCEFAPYFITDYMLAPLADSVVLCNDWRFSARFEGLDFFILLKI